MSLSRNGAKNRDKETGTGMQSQNHNEWRRALLFVYRGLS